MAENMWIDLLGVTVIDESLYGLYGAYVHQARAIYLDPRLAPIQRRSTLMHELGHAYYGHTETTARTEREASEWAARQMIPGCEFDQLTRMFDSPVAVANELGVLPRDVLFYQQWMSRVAPGQDYREMPKKAC